MAAARKVEDFFTADILDLKVDVELPFDVFLYFKTSQHILLWVRKGEKPNGEFLSKYMARGIKTVWISKQDAELFKTYRAQAKKAPPQAQPSVKATAETVQGTLASVSQAAASKTAASSIIEIMHSDDPETQKQASLAKTARELVQKSLEPQDLSAQKKADSETQKIVLDILNDIGKGSAPIASEIWRLSNSELELTHATNVAAYSVMFALAFGKIESSMLADLALAGLLHDVGLTQVSATLCRTAWTEQTPGQAEGYHQHVQAGLELIRHFAPQTPERVLDLIHHHHEKFDGTGYPKRIEGFKVDLISQILAIAEALDSIASGQWDGKPRTYQDSLALLETQEKQRTFPERFNPEIFASFSKWARRENPEKEEGLALELVSKAGKTLKQRTG